MFGTEFVIYYIVIKTTDTMTREQIHKVIANLSYSQGFYGRLMNGNYGDYDEILDWLVNEIKPTDVLEVIYALEQ